MSNESLKQNLILISQKVDSLGLSPGSSGNLSVRIPGGMLITPRSISFKDTNVEDLISIDLDGNPLKDETSLSNRKYYYPSSEWRLHSQILRHRSEINSVLHCHSINATAIACHGIAIPSFHYMVAIAGGYDIKCADYETFGTTELSKNALKALEGRFACLLANHGQLAISESPEKSLEIAIEVEALAHTYLKSLHIGQPKLLSKNEMKIISNKFISLGYK